MTNLRSLIRVVYLSSFAVFAPTILTTIYIICFRALNTVSVASYKNV